MGNGEITISFKLDMTINEISTTFLLSITISHYWVFVITNNVDFGQMMRHKYIVSNILENFYVEDTQLQLLWGVKKQCN